jgi:hypothetical protein
VGTATTELVISLDSQPGTYPQDLVHSVLCEVFDRVQDTIDAGGVPPGLHAAVDRVSAFQRQDAARKLDEALQDVAHGAIANLARLRASIDPRVTGI